VFPAERRRIRTGDGKQTNKQKQNGNTNNTTEETTPQEGKGEQEE